MTAPCFVDTNILLYAGSNAPDDQAKRQVARQVLSQPGIGFSAQVLQEFYSAAVTSEDLNDGQDYDGVRVVNPFSKETTPVASP